MWVDVGGAAAVSVASEAEASVGRAVARAFSPYPQCVDPPNGGGVQIRPTTDAPTFRDIENAAGDGLVTAYDGSRAFILSGRQACSIPDPVRDDPAVFSYTPGFRVQELLRSYVRPAVALSALRREAVVVHASGVSIDGRAVLIGGWSESGKTEVALALAESGATFLADKWSIVRSDGCVCPFPASVGIRRWVLPYLPRLRAGLPGAARAQLAAAAGVSFVSGPFRRSFRNPILREAGSRAAQISALADRAALSLGQVRGVYGSARDVTTPVPLGLVVLLETVAPGTPATSAAVDAGEVARRLAQAAAYERRAFFGVTERARYGGASGERIDGPTVAGIETRLLAARLADARVVLIRTPFPADPRHAAELVRLALADR